MSKKPLLESMAFNATDLPSSLQSLVSLIGLEKTLRLVAEFGGLSILIPKGHTAFGQAMFDRLASVIGPHATSILCDHYGGRAATLYVPRCADALRLARDRVIIAAFGEMTERDGLSARAAVAALAREHQLGESQVWRILKTTPSTPRTNPDQGTLFALLA